MSHLRLMQGGAPTNSFEAERRLAKVNSLAITLEIATRNMSPEDALAVVKGMTPELWRETAVVSGQRAPTPTTIGQVVERFERLAELARRVS